MKKLISILLIFGCNQSASSQSDSSKWQVNISYSYPVFKNEFDYTKYKESLGADLKFRGTTFSIYRSVIDKSKLKYQLGLGFNYNFYQFRELPYHRALNGDTFYADLIGSQFVLTINNRLGYNLPDISKHRNYLAFDFAIGLIQYERKVLDDGTGYSHDGLNNVYKDFDIANPLYLYGAFDYGFDLFANEFDRSLFLLLGVGSSINDGIDFYKFSIDGRIGLSFVW